MHWIHHYQLFLFDFDGILVNTEDLHYKSYLRICADRGFTLNWDERTYFNHAMFSSTGLKEGIYKELPALELQEPCWEVLYEEKKRVYLDLLKNQEVVLMPGVEKLLIELQEAKIKRCVVTHSLQEQIECIREQHPILNTIPTWITREHYLQPKPSSECYLKAIAMLKAEGDSIIGFEDSPRGLQALLGTEAHSIFLTPYFEMADVKQLSEASGRAFRHFASFPELFKNFSG